MKKRILITGFGSIGQRHLRIIRESLPDAEIGIFRHRLTEEIPDGADNLYTSLSEAMAFRPQLAVIANPAPFHLQTASALADTGCHVLIEKPLAADTKGVINFIQRLGHVRIVCLVGYNLRYLPSLMEFRRLLQEGVIGQVLSVRSEVGQYLPDWRPGIDYRQGVSARRELGGGVLLELSHEIDYLRWVFGAVEWVSAWCGKLSELCIDVEDSAQLTLGFSGTGMVATLGMDFIRRDSTRTCTVIGSKGSLRWDGLAGTIDWYDPAISHWKKAYNIRQGRDDSYRTQWQHFLDCVDRKQMPAVSAQDGLAVLKIIEAAKRSAAKRGTRQNVAE